MSENEIQLDTIPASYWQTIMEAAQSLSAAPTADVEESVDDGDFGEDDWDSWG